MGVKDRESPSGSGEPILAFGIVRPFDTVLGKIEGTVASDQFQDGDRVVAVGNQPIHHSWDLTKLQDTLPPLPTTITVLRDGERAAIMVQPSLRSRGKVFLPKDGGIVRAKEILDVNDETVLIRLADGKEKRLNRDDLDEDFLLDILGCRPRVKITGIGDDSPAQAAGLEPGDILLDYGDRGVPSYREMVETNKAMVGTRTSVVVLRDGQAKSGLWVVPKMHRGRTVIGINASVDMSTAVVAGIRKDSPAQKAGIRSGDVIERITGTVASAASQPASGTSTAPSSVSRPAASEPATAAAAAPATAPASQPAGGHPGDVDRPVKGWADAYEALKACRDKDVVITYRRGSIAGRAHIGTLTSEIFEPQDYWVLPFDTPRSFQPLLGPVVRKGPLQAVAWGVNETWIFVRRTYATLRSLLSGTISHKEVIGPVGMGDVAIQMGRESIARLIYFMAMISVSLAVINFLPIPVVDGGHAVFLIIEKIRGKPVPVKVMNIVQLLGLALLLFVFVAVTWQDISRMLSDLW